MSEPILGAFKLRPLSESEESSVAEPIRPLPFEETVALLINDYEAHPHAAREITISAVTNGESTLINPLTHRGVRISYSA